MGAVLVPGSGQTLHGMMTEIVRVVGARPLGAEAIEKIARVVSEPGGPDALNLQVREHYIRAMSGLADSKIILPGNLANFDDWMSGIGLNDSDKSK